MSIIHDIEIKNFKSIRHQKIEGCKRINVLVGEPNVGKSNILEALGVFTVNNLRHGLNFKFDEICRVKKPIELFFNSDSREVAYVGINSHQYSFDLQLILRQRLKLTFSGLDINNISPFEINTQDYNIAETNTGNSVDGGLLGSFQKFDFVKNVSELGNVSPILAMPNGNNLLHVLSANSELRREVIDLFKKYNLKLNIDWTDGTIKFQKELTDESVVSIPYHQIADTLQRLIFYKAAIESHSRSVMLFEEPESHMYPPFISKLTSEIINDKNHNQYFIATHSPFVMQELMENANDDLSIYTVGYKSETGETVINKLSEDDMKEAYQLGYDFFLNIDQFLPQE